MNKQNFLKQELLQYIGDFSQLFGIKSYTLVEGKAKGVRAFDVNNGAGLSFTVLQDRCLDIAELSLNGTNCSYISRTGTVAPEHYSQEGVGFLRSFTAGFLTTCGLRNVGSPCEQNGETFTMHGRISNVPAEEVCAVTEWIKDIPFFTISGKMREARLFGENLVLSRKISCRYGENKITIRNKVENMGFKREALMLLFHFNLGYPLLDENAVLVVPTAGLIPRDLDSEKGKSKYAQCQPPTPGYREQVFYHKLKADQDGYTQVALINEKLNLGVVIQFNKNQLFNFTQWKQMGEGEYVMGLEPCNCFVGGRTDPRNEKKLEYLEPGGSRNFDLSVELISEEKQINDFLNYKKTNLGE